MKVLGPLTSLVAIYHKRAMIAAVIYRKYYTNPCIIISQQRRISYICTPLLSTCITQGHTLWKRLKLQMIRVKKIPSLHHKHWFIFSFVHILDNVVLINYPELSSQLTKISLLLNKELSESGSHPYQLEFNLGIEECFNIKTAYQKLMRDRCSHSDKKIRE